MKVAVISNDVVPNMGLPCSGQGIRALGTARMFAAAGAEADVLMQDQMTLQRITRWSGDFHHLAIPPSVRMFRVGALAAVLGDYDLVVLHNWAAGHALDALRTSRPKILYDFFSATLVEHAHFDRGAHYIEEIRTRKRATVGLAGLFWGNGEGRVDYARAFLGAEAIAGEVLDAPMWYPATRPTRRPLVTVGGFAQAWTVGLPVAAIERISARLPDHEIAVLGGGEHYHIRTKLVERDRIAADNVRMLGPIAYEDYVRLMASSAAFVDVAPMNDERRLSFSSRALVALAAGCPVVHNAETDLGRLIEAHGAGVVVPSEAGLEIGALVDAVVLCAREDRTAACAALHASLEARTRAAVERTISLCA